MKHGLIGLTAIAVIAAPANAVQVGAPAPGFSLTDQNGRTVKLSDQKGKIVVLEWNNPECPFVRKHYDSGNMQKAQAAAKRDGIVWLTINSSAPGKQGNVNAAAAKSLVSKEKSDATSYLLDPSGTVGKLYDAKTTPHMFVIDKSGTLVYAGGIDDKPTANKADIATARNHVLAALADLKAGRKVAVQTSRPYGCSVKYQS